MNELLRLSPEDFPDAPSPLDALMSPAAQRAFLGGRHSPVSCSVSSGTSMSPPVRRLAGTGGYEEVLGFLAHYVGLVVPEPVATEGSFWAVEAVLDSPAPVGELQQLVRLSVHSVAVATVVEDLDGDGKQPLVCLALAPGAMVTRPGPRSRPIWMWTAPRCRHSRPKEPPGTWPGLCGRIRCCSLRRAGPWWG